MKILFILLFLTSCASLENSKIVPEKDKVTPTTDREVGSK